MAELMQDTDPGVPYVDIIDLTAELVRAHVSRSDVPPEMLRTLIVEVHETLRSLSEPRAEPAGGSIPVPPVLVLASPERRAQVISPPPEHRTPTASPPVTAASPPALHVVETSPTAAPASREPAPPVAQPARRASIVRIPKPLPTLPEEDRPAVPTERSLTVDAVIDLQSGRPHRDLGRFLSDSRGETPEDYRRKFGLPPEYPMMAPRLIRSRGRVSELDPKTFRRLSSGPVERDARFDGEAS